MENNSAREHRKACLKITLVLLAVWFMVSLGCAVLFRGWMDTNMPMIGNAKFGFWMAQQGSIYVFVVLIFIYVRLMNRLEGEYASGIKNSNSTQDLGKEKS